MMKYQTLPHYWINHLGFLLRKQLVQAFSARGHQITAEEWAALLILQAEEGMTSTDLSNASFRDKTTITRLVDKLVAKDLVARRPNSKDRRQMRLHLTERGQAIFLELAEIAQEFIARSTQGISGEAMRTTVETLVKMTDNLKTPLESEAKNGL